MRLTAATQRPPYPDREYGPTSRPFAPMVSRRPLDSAAAAEAGSNSRPRRIHRPHRYGEMTTMNGWMNDWMAAGYAAAILLVGYLAATEGQNR